MNSSKKVDKTIFFASIIISLALIIWNLLANDSFTGITGAVFSKMSGVFGWLFLLGYNFFLVALIILAFSKYGKIRLCKNYNDKPEYKLMTWVAMMFASGLGVGLTYYGVYVSLDHYYNPPFGLVARSSEAWTIAPAYATWYHGLHPWAGYVIVGLIIAYFSYNQNVGGLFSTPLTYVFSKKNPDGSPKLNAGWGKAIDVYIIVVTLVGLCASYSIACSMLGAGLYNVFSINNDIVLKLIILAVLTMILVLSTYKGVSKGMAFMSDMNLYLCYIILGMMVIFGPTIDILKGLIEGISGLLGNYLKMTFFMDATGATKAAMGFDFARDWPIMLLAFFMAWTPFVGIFIAKVSRGRSIKELVLGGLLLPTIFCYVWNYIFGTSAIVLDNATNGGLMALIGGDWSNCLYALYSYLPLKIVFGILTLFVCTTFILTSCDSADYCISVLSCRGDIDPPTIVRVTWAIIMGGFATIFLIGGAKAIQNIQGIATLPMFFLIPVMFFTFMKVMKEDYKTKYCKQIRLEEMRKLQELDDSISIEDQELMDVYITKISTAEK